MTGNWKPTWLCAAVAVCLVIAGVAIPARAQDHLQSGDLVGVCGDSITEQKDYSVDMEAYLLMCRPPVRTMQFGWGGDTVGGILSRTSIADILATHPTVFTTCFGMNDGGYTAVNPNTIKRYHDGTTAVVQRMKQGGVRVIVVGSPGCVDADTFRHDPQQAVVYNQTLAALRDVARQVAREQNCLFANVHDPMMDVMTKAKARYGDQYHLAGPDGVHPAHNGHLVMAYAFLKALGCDGNIGTIKLDMAANKAEGSEGHKILAVNNDTVQVESSRYPFCFYGKSEDPDATRGVIEFFPFNDDLNRFQLLVPNSPTERLHITWGTVSKVFAAADLAKGINLAAEFLDNPFSSPFQKVVSAIQAKQNYETTLYKNLLPDLAPMQTILADEAPQDLQAITQVHSALISHDQKLAAGAAATVAPVVHTIKVEAVR